jgi:hypothetical protein
MILIAQSPTYEENEKMRTINAFTSCGISLAATVFSCIIFTASAQAQFPPPPPSVGATVPATYFGPVPSDVKREYIGPYQLLKSGKIDLDARTITLPLYEGKMKDGRKVWYVLTDTTDAGNAAALGLNYAAKLNYASVGRAARHATLEKDTSLTFQSGTVDFSPKRRVVPGDAPNFFPPKAAEPGSIGDQDYSPLIIIDNAGGVIYNAPIVAFNVDASQIDFCEGHPDYALVHDKVASICPKTQTVTLQLTEGLSFGRPVLYLSLDANDGVPAALEGVTLAPALKELTVGHDDSAFSATERIFLFANGPTGKENPQRQGLNSALSDGLSPLNVLGGIPTVATDYSPLWDLNLGVWTKESIEKSYRSRMLGEFQILDFVQKGFITGPNGGKFGSTGFIVNCPIVWRYL